jgi:hypothetical protein
LAIEGARGRENSNPLSPTNLHFWHVRRSDQRLLEKAVVSKIAFGHGGIVHVQIASNGKMAFAAYDNFDRKCVVAYFDVSPSSSSRRAATSCSF